MSRLGTRCLCLSVLLVAVSPGYSCSADVPEAPRVGRQVAPFTLDDVHGEPVSLASFAEKKLVVLAFLGTECPLARLYAPRLADLARRFEPQGVVILGIDSNVQDSIAEIANYARVHGIPFAMLKDTGNELADRIGAVRTPEVFVLDENRIVRYWGRVDNQYSIGIQRPAATRQDLAEALQELLADKPVSVPTTRVPGCHIGRARKPQSDGPVTWHRQIGRASCRERV